MRLYAMRSSLTSQTTESTSTTARSLHLCCTGMPQSLYGGYCLRKVLKVYTTGSRKLWIGSGRS